MSSAVGASQAPDPRLVRLAGQSRNFRFLLPHLPLLVAYGTAAESHVFSDPNTSVGTRSSVQRVCADSGQAADLVTAVLASLEGGGTGDAAAKYRRQENKARKRRRPNAVHVIVNSGALDEGAPLHLALYLQPERDALAEWLAANPRRALAKWTNTNRARPIVWAADGIAYSPSGLIARMWELAEWEERPVSNQGTARWATQDGETLAVLARRLLDGMEEEKEAE